MGYIVIYVFFVLFILTPQSLMWQGFRGFMRHRGAGWSEFRFKMPPKMPPKMPVDAMFIGSFAGMLRLQ